MRYGRQRLAQSGADGPPSPQPFAPFLSWPSPLFSSSFESFLYSFLLFFCNASLLFLSFYITFRSWLFSVLRPLPSIVTTTATYKSIYTRLWRLPRYLSPTTSCHSFIILVFLGLVDFTICLLLFFIASGTVVKLASRTYCNQLAEPLILCSPCCFSFLLLQYTPSKHPVAPLPFRLTW